MTFTDDFDWRTKTNVFSIRYTKHIDNEIVHSPSKALIIIFSDAKRLYIYSNKDVLRVFHALV